MRATEFAFARRLQTPASAPLTVLTGSIRPAEKNICVVPIAIFAGDNCQIDRIRATATGHLWSEDFAK
jgi:hypothetical protein